MKKHTLLLSCLSALSLMGTSCSSTEEVVYFNETTKNIPVVVNRLEAKEGQVEALKAQIGALVDSSRLEAGNLCYNVYQDQENLGKFIVYEIWESKEALKKHTDNPLVKSFNADTTYLVGAPTFEVYERSISEMPKSSANGLVLFAKINAIDGKATELQAVLESLIVPTLAEAGAEHYELHKLNGDVNGFLFHETWTTQAEWDAHMLTPHLVEFLGNQKSYVEGDINLSRTKLIF